MENVKTIKDLLEEGALNGSISVSALTAVMNKHFGTSYAARQGEGRKQTPLYQALIRGYIHEANPPAYMRGKWVVVDKALEDYLNQFRPQQHKEKSDDDESDRDPSLDR